MYCNELIPETIFSILLSIFLDIYLPIPYINGSPDAIIDICFSLLLFMYSIISLKLESKTIFSPSKFFIDSKFLLPPINTSEVEIKFSPFLLYSLSYQVLDLLCLSYKDLH